MSKSLIRFSAAFLFLASVTTLSAQPATRPPTNPGTPALVAAGPNAEALAKAALNKSPDPGDSAKNPAEAPPGANPPATVDGNFLIGPVYVSAPELTENPGIPHGRVGQFVMDSKDTKFYPGIGRDVFGKVDPNNPKTLIVETHPAPYKRAITVYIPSQAAPDKPACLLVTHDGPGIGKRDMSLPHILDNMIAARRVPPIVVVMIANGGGDAQGNERGLEYDTMSGKFAEFIQEEVLTQVESTYGIKISKDPDARCVMGCSSGAAAALEMAWYHNDWYHRVISYSGTFVNQQWPFNPETPGGAWDFHEKLIPSSDPKPLRIWMQVGDTDLLNPNVMRDGMHDWVEANNHMATVLRAKGYHYQYVYALNAKHCAGQVRSQTLPEALEWVWHDYSEK